MARQIKKLVRKNIAIQDSFIKIGLFPLQSKQDAKESWIKGKKLYMGKLGGKFSDISRVVVLVRHRQSGSACFMDAITGSLYNARSGRCLSSDCLDMAGVSRQPEQCTTQLMSIKIDREYSDGGVA